jgi:hypothetical protein
MAKKRGHLLKGISKPASILLPVYDCKGKDILFTLQVSKGDINKGTGAPFSDSDKVKLNFLATILRARVESVLYSLLSNDIGGR